MKTNYRFIQYILGVSLLCMVIQSCVKKFDISEVDYGIQLNPHLGIPVFNGEFKIKDLIKETKKTPTNFSSIEYYENKTRDSNGTKIRFIYDIDTIRTITAKEYLRSLPYLEPYTTTLPIPSLKVPDELATGTLSFGTLTKDNFSSPTYDYYVGESAKNIVTTIPKNNVNDGVTPFMYPLTIKNLSADWIVYTIRGKTTATLTNKSGIPLRCKLQLLTIIDGKETIIATYNFDQAINLTPGTKEQVIGKTQIKNKLFYKFTDIYYETASNITVDLAKQINVDFLIGNIEATNGYSKVENQQIGTSAKDTTIWVDLITYKNRKVSIIDVEKGNFFYEVKSTFNVDFKVDVVLPTVTKGGKSLTVTKIFTPNNQVKQTLKLDGYRLRLDTKDPQNQQGYNKLPIKLRYELLQTKGPVNFDVNKNFIIFTLSNSDSLSFERIIGDLGNDQFAIPSKGRDTSYVLDISDFTRNKNYFRGDIIFEEPKLEVNYINTFGMGAKMAIAIKADNQILIDTVVNDLKRNMPEQTPVVSLGKKEVKGMLDFARNSDTAQIELRPRGNVFLNYNSKRTLYSDSIFNTSLFKVNVHTELPFIFTMNSFKITPAPFLNNASGSFDIKKIEVIDKLLFKLWTSNTIPLDCKIAIYMLDTTQINPELGLLNEGVENSLFKAGNSPDGTANVFEFVVSKSITVENFKKANKFRVEAEFNTYNKGVVTIRTYQSLKFQLYVEALVKYNSKL